MEKLSLVLSLSIWASGIGWAQTNSVSLRSGDVLYVDSGNGIIGSCVVKFDPNTAEQTIIVSHLNLPEGIALDAQGRILLASYSSIIRVDLADGSREVVADVGKFGGTYGLALSGSGDIFTAYIGGRLLGPPHRDYFSECEKHDPKFKLESGVLRINPATGAMRSVGSGHLFVYPLGVAVADNGDLFVNNIAFPGQIVRVSARGGPDKIVSSGDHLHYPLGIVVSGRYAYVTDVATDDQNFGIGAIVKVDIETGAQTVLTVGDNLLKPVGITLDLNGQLIVTDPYTINRDSRDLYDGGIIRIDPMTGTQTLLGRGHGGIVNPLAVTVVRPSASGNVGRSEAGTGSKVYKSLIQNN